MNNDMMKAFDYFKKETGGGMLGHLAMTRLKLLVGQGVIENLDKVSHGDDFLANTVVRAIEIILGKNIPDTIIIKSTTDSKS